MNTEKIIDSPNFVPISVEDIIFPVASDPIIT